MSKCQTPFPSDLTNDVTTCPTVSSCFVSLLRLSDSFSAFFCLKAVFHSIEILPQADGKAPWSFVVARKRKKKKENYRGHVYRFTGYSRRYCVCILGITGPIVGKFSDSLLNVLDRESLV